VAPADVDSGSDASRQQLEWVRQGVSFSGRERHCCFLNLRDGSFADISAVTGLDLPDDGRGVGRVDWDGDGDVDLWIANRNGPQLRFLRNDFSAGHHYLALRLEGRTSNRDAIGARVELVVPGPPSSRQVRTVRAGDGYLSQSSKWVHFGLGSAEQIQRVSIRWPSGKTETLTGIEVDRRYRLVEGTGRAVPVGAPRRTSKLVAQSLAAPATSDQGQILLAASCPLPDLAYKTFAGELRRVPRSGQRPLLIHLWASWCRPCLAELSSFAREAHRLHGAVDVLALSVDAIDDRPGSKEDAEALLTKLAIPFPAGLATADMLEKLQLVHNHLFDVHRAMPVPTSFLVQPGQGLAAIYKGPVDVERIVRDVALLDRRGDVRRTAALPLRGHWLARQRPIHLLPLAWNLIQAGYLEDGIDYIARNRRILTGDREFAKLLALTGYELLERGELARAADQYRKAIAVNPKETVARLNLAVALIRMDKYDEARAQYRQALLDNPHDPRVHYTLAWLLATAPDPAVRSGDEAVRLAQRVIQMSGRHDALMLEVLAAAYAEAGKFDQAVSAARKAVGLLQEKGDAKGTQRVERQLDHYLRGEPFRDVHHPLPAASRPDA